MKAILQIDLDLDPRCPSGSIYLDNGFGFSQSHYFVLCRATRRRTNNRTCCNANIREAYSLVKCLETLPVTPKVKRNLPFRITFLFDKECQEVISFLKSFSTLKFQTV